MPPCLAGLPLDEIEHFILAFEQQVVKAQKDPLAIGKSARAPRRLGGACAAYGEFQIRDGSGRDAADAIACVGRAHGNGLTGAAGQRDLREQAIQQGSRGKNQSGRRRCTR